MINNVEFERVEEVTKVVSLGKDEDIIKFASDLRESLDSFKLSSITCDGADKKITFSCDCLDDYTGAITNHLFIVSNDNKVLIKNRRLVSSECSGLINNKLIHLK